ncbi:kelch-like protein 22 isoform X2 [Bos indicus]|uniref:Kelch-like protein 22 n=4 Tax=Bos TaxID=9903 RepID=A0AAA9THR2_BOVIN|nr:kelch-like protein 22 isoform X2 [Bos taurus]XP_024833168.1 kelch-like protein 22 isoform X2 [Bos taurus]XP_024833169.1 kelch-like protein 22 isoform X2 [Bos taurus]
MAEEQEFARLCKLPTQPSHPHCVSSTYRSAQHSQALLRGLLALRDSGILFDVVLVVEGKQLEAHRILLAASCDYFRGMFAGGLKEMEQEEVLIHGVSYNAMCQILHFIYTSELELSLSNVQETLVAACQLQIPEIIHFCCDFLTPWVDEDNILDVYRLAELFDLSRLTEQLDAYILKNFVAFSRTDKYRQLPLEKVYALLSSNRLEVSCETEVYEGALLYHYPPEQVQADRLPLHEPPKLLETVRFPLMEAEVLQRLHDKLEPSPLRDTVAEALMYHRNESLQPSLQGPQTELRSDFQCVVGFGGIHSTPSTVLSDQAKYLNPLLGEWKHFTASLAPRMSNQGIAVLNNFVYLIGGDNNVQGFRAESRCWRYDPRHNRWFQIQPLQQEHADLCVCVVGGYIYAVAGRDYHNDLTAVERYDPATNSWAYVAPLKREVYAHAGAALDGKMYVTCGRRGEDYLKETHCYEPGSDTWHTLADGPVRRAWHGMATLLDKLYVIGGSNNDAGYRRDVHQGRPTPPSGCAESIRPLTLGLAKWWPFQVACYSCRSGQWSSVCPLPAGHGEPGIAVLDSRIYVLGGRSHNRGSRTGYVHIYDAGRDRWEEGPQLDNSISGLAACVLTLPRSLLLEPPRGTPDRSQADPDFASEVMSVSDWEEFDNSSED